MANVRRRAAAARSRLILNAFFEAAALAALLTASLWALALLADRLFALGLPLGWSALAVAVVAVLGAAVRAYAQRPTLVAAAAVMDRAAGLKERLSSALALPPAPADAFARAVVADAEKTAASVHVPSHVPLRTPAALPWSIATLLAAGLLAYFMPTMNLLARDRAAQGLTAEQASQLATEREAVQAEIETRMKELRDLAATHPDLQAMVDDLKPFEMPDAPTQTPDEVRREALKAIEELTSKVEAEREKVEDRAIAETKNLLAKLNTPKGDDPASKLAQSLSGGDFKGAQEALEQMKQMAEEAAKNSNDPAKQQQLAEMAERMQKLAQEMAQLSDTERLAKELENKAGMTPDQARQMLDQLSRMDPKQLEKELQKRLGETGMNQKQMQELARKIQKQQQAQQQAQQMSQAMQQAAQAMQQQCQNHGAQAQQGQQGQQGQGGQAGQSAADALGNAAEQLSQMEMTEQMMNELEAQMAQMQQSRQDVSAGQCQGNQGQGQSGTGRQGPNAGIGMGKGIGKERLPHRMTPERAEQRGQGATIGRMLVDGPQVKGEARAAVQQAAASGMREVADAIEQNEIPRQYETVLRKYFERLAGLDQQPDGDK